MELEQLEQYTYHWICFLYFRNKSEENSRCILKLVFLDEYMQ